MRLVFCTAVMSGSVGTNVKNKLNEFESVGTGGGPAESSAASTDAAIDSLLQLVANLRSTIDSIGLFRNRSNSPLSELNADDVGILLYCTIVHSYSYEYEYVISTSHATGR